MGEAFVKTPVITDLILVHVLVVNLERVGRQLLCLEQLPVAERRGKMRRHEERTQITPPIDPARAWDRTGL